jgi:hypothetical protein
MINCGAGIRIVVAVCLAAIASPVSADVQLCAGTKFRFADVKQGVAALSKRDEFVAAMSPFDRQVRLQTDRPVNEAAYLKHVADQVVAWNDADREKLTLVVTAAGKRLAGWKLPLPETILLVETTGREEGGAAYCRGAVIVLPRGIVRRPAKSLERLLLHELFHVLSNQNPKLRERLYKIVGFVPCGDVKLPPDLAKRKLTNPDAPVMRHMVDVIYKESPVKAVPILFSKSDKYDAKSGRNLFSYLTFRLMVVEMHDGKWHAAKKDGKPVLFDAKNTPSYFKKIGRNTGYIIHPEEVLADNFVLLLYKAEKVKTPQVLAGMRKVLNAKQK